MDTDCIRNTYISCGSSIRPNCLAWGSNDVLCFGNKKAVVISKISEAPSICQTLVGHKEEVVHVSFIDNRTSDEQYDNRILSTSTDQTSIIWSPSDAGLSKYDLTSTIKTHTAAVTRGHGVTYQRTCINDSSVCTLISTSSSDSSLCISESDGNASFKLKARFSFDRGFVLALQWMCLPNQEPVLVTGDDRGNVIFYKRTSDSFAEILSIPVHSDWIRDMTVQILDNGESLLATSSQDCSIKIHKLSPSNLTSSTNKDAISRPVTTLAISDIESYTVILESVLVGHENWVYSLNWKPNIYKASELILLSASMDKSMILWALDTESCLWIEKARLGDVGGNSLGYIGGCWSVCGEKLASQSFDGALQLWSHSDSDGQSFWRPSTTFGGHVLQVKDIAWQPVDGNFLLSASLDQTVRLYGQWDHNGGSTWYELARPQIHGYNMQCVSMLNKQTMISAGEEKIIRVFGATKNFIDNFQNLTGKTLMDERDKEKLPTGASIPALGLSNKACSDTDTGGDCGSGTNNYVEQCFQSLNLSEPATTSDLSQNTLWPEKEKLYGHGYDVYSIAVHPDTNTVASACKATNAKHAAVILWDAETWRIRQHVEGHSLTVTGIAFSRRDGRYMLTVSRDRTWNVYRQNADQTYELLIQTDKRTSGHTRIIWSCCWSHDDLYFCTVSRDKKAIVWKTPSQNTSAIPESYSLTLNSSITAVDFAPTLLGNNSYLISLGDESGYIHLYSFSEDSSFTHLHTMDNCFAHQDTVTKLAFRPSKESASHTTTLASCSADSSVKLYDINMNSLQ